MVSTTVYRGRFAPTPSGPLHLGSLLTAVASFVQARHAGGAWLLRIDDLDGARCPAGVDDTILRQLEVHALLWDERPRRQSACRAEYDAAIGVLESRGALYRCGCSREVLRRTSRPGPDDPVYAGTCRGTSTAAPKASLRLRAPDEVLCVDDGWQGRVCRRLSDDVGDFIVRRADGVPAYQLACAVDEAAQGITEVVRGADLLGSTFRQLHVQASLGLAPATYRHLPVIVDRQGRKLSKQNHAPAVRAGDASANLWHCLALLNQQPPRALQQEAPAAILQWAVAHWSAASVPRVAQLHPL